MSRSSPRSDGLEKWRPSMAMVVGAVLLVVLTLPLAGMTAVVIATRPPQALLQSVADNVVAVVLAGLLVAGATALVGFLFWRLVSRPIWDLVAWTGQVALSDASRSARMSYGTRELARLGVSFEAMVHRLDERSAYISTYTAHVSHELKSPLTAILGTAEILRDSGDEMGAAERARFVQNIERDARRLSALVARMRELARVETARSSGVSDITTLASRLRDRYPEIEIVEMGDAASVPLPFEDAFLILSHLADNATAHGARTLTVRSCRETDRTVLTVENDGPPISPRNQAEIFEPFFTTRREAGGTGMGLAIVRALLKAHGGEIGFDQMRTESRCGSFEVGFRIVLPDQG